MIFKNSSKMPTTYFHYRDLIKIIIVNRNSYRVLPRGYRKVLFPLTMNRSTNNKEVNNPYINDL